MSVVVSNSIPHQGEVKNHALISYILLAIGLFTAIPLLIGAVWAMIKKSSALGTVYHSHYVNATRVFWWSLFWTVLGFITVFILIGYAILGLAWLWALYRVINGFAKILADEPYPL